MGFCFAFFIIIFREGKIGASAQIGREQEFQSGQIPENAEEQQYRHAAPEQDVFRPAAFGKPGWIPQRPYQNPGEPERSEQGGGKVFAGCTGKVQPQQPHTEMGHAAARTGKPCDFLENAGDAQRRQLGEEKICQPQQQKNACRLELLAVSAEKSTQILEQKDTSEQKKLHGNSGAAFVFQLLFWIMPAGSARSASVHRK